MRCSAGAFGLYPVCYGRFEAMPSLLSVDRRRYLPRIRCGISETDLCICGVNGRRTHDCAVERPVDKGVYEVSFRGNGLTPISQAENMVLLKSAELTLANGYQRFALLPGERRWRCHDKGSQVSRVGPLADVRLSCEAYGHER